MFVFHKTFIAEASGSAIHGGTSLESKVVRAMRNICQQNGKLAKRDLDGVGSKLPGLLFWNPPVKLDAERDNLKDEWRTIWRHCTLEYDKNEAGASILGARSSDARARRRIRIGPFFLREGFSVKDLEKVILHEFLHAAFIFSDFEFHHGMMEQVLIYNLGYDRPANPAGTD